MNAITAGRAERWTVVPRQRRAPFSRPTLAAGMYVVLAAFRGRSANVQVYDVDLPTNSCGRGPLSCCSRLAARRVYRSVRYAPLKREEHVLPRKKTLFPCSRCSAGSTTRIRKCFFLFSSDLHLAWPNVCTVDAW